MKKKCFSILRVTSLVFVLLNLYPLVVSAQPLNKETFNFAQNAGADILCQTPPMGWNSWNAFHTDITEQKIKDAAQALVSSGMKAAGYEYINIDDAWMDTVRDAQGRLQPDPKRFPHGIKALADYVHSLGLKIGIYESAGTKTCAGFPGSLYHEKTDAESFAKWGIDYLKLDNCSNEGVDYMQRYEGMEKALLATGRPIVYSICEWGVKDPYQWAPAISQLWRTTGDISDNWNSMINITDQQVGLQKYAGPGHWNDPDMLEVGNGGMTNNEYRTHFSLWAIMAAPLIAGNDLLHMTEATKEILTNKDVIAVDQDPAGKEGYKVEDDGDQEVWVKPMSDGSFAVLLLNRGEERVFMTTNVEQVGLQKAPSYKVVNLWDKGNRYQAGTYSTSDLIRSSVASHGVAMFRVWPESK
ncbi:glycoside hydrolase family 27 protein [Hanamia caeni]|uniref:Alpha-galactosidase n=1 Tax=Hanamia caeni TaxID=2294116 RepID=A0A3M9NQL2_9BACT|nr:glycoside hydrolase family 27 protein [Hanamia caeni]RNI39974.1 glycoside hydrolase family 27 protein [Hanamia caeni]